jgi:4-carboxymuconolactone decarboxylase
MVFQKAPVRLAPLAPGSFTDAQRAAEADFVKTRNVGFSGPWHVFIRSPELLTHAQRMGEYLRYRCPLAGRLSELAILLVAREWTQDFEWGAHRTHALAAGLAPSIIEAIREQRRPDVAGDDAIVWNYVTELMRTRRVSDTTYAEALARFGEKGVVDLAGIVGYYSLLAMTMNVARVASPEGEEPLPRYPD